MALPQMMSKVRKLLGLLVFWGVFYACVLSYPAELNKLLGISNILSEGEQLNGPNDMTMLIRMVFGLVAGVAADIMVLKVFGKLFPISVLATALPSRRAPTK